MKLQVLFFIAVLGVTSVFSEVELICPQPVSTSSSVTTYTELSPGPRTIVFRETTSINGSPFRLSIRRSGTDCVILDHIPWQSDSDTYYITVNIPEIRCNGASDDCRLILWQIDTGSSNGYCPLSECQTYNSTAAVSIKRNGGPINCPNRRTNYNLYNWPFDPVRRYVSTLTNSPATTARAAGTFLLIGQTIIYTVNITTPFTDTQPETVRFVYYPEGSDELTVLSIINIPSGQMGVRGSWTQVSDFEAYVFRNTTMYVQMIASGNTEAGEGEIMGRITASGQNAVDDIYGLEHGTYTTSGWLAGEMFVEAGANATLFTQPHGPCTLSITRYFGCMLSSSNMAGGTVGMSVTGNRLWFSMDMYNLSSPISSVTITGVSIDDVDLTSFWSDGYRLRGLTDISDEVQTFITSGLASVSISTTDNTRELSCTADEGIISFLDSFYEVPAVTVTSNGTATAFLYFSVDGAMNFQVTLNSLTSPLLFGHLHGPAYQGISTSSIPLDMSSYITGNMEGGWNIQVTWRNLTANEFRYFVENLYYLNMHTESNPNGELRGQVSTLGDWICPSTDKLINQCYWPRLNVPSGVTVTNNDYIPTAVGGVVIDRYERLQYSLAFWYIPDDEILTVTLLSRDGTLQTVTVDTNDNSNIRDNVREIYMVYPAEYDGMLSETELMNLENGNVWFNVTSTNYPDGLLTGYLPPLSRNRCASTMAYNIAIGGMNGWAPTGNEFPLMRLLQGDMLNFTFSSPDNLYEMVNANRLAGCVFGENTATLLADAINVDPNTYYYDLAIVGYHYFSSSASCQNQKMRLTTFTVDAVPITDRLGSSSCSGSLYSYSGDQRQSSSSGVSGAVVATIVGLIIGITIAVVAIVIGVFVMIKGKVNDGGNVAKP